MAIAANGTPGHAVNGSATSLAANITTTSTNCIVCCVVTCNGGPIVSVTGSGLTFTFRGNDGANVHDQVEIWTAPAASTLSAVSITATQTNANQYMAMDVFAFSGADTSSPLDGAAVTGHPDPLSISTSVADTVIVGCYREGSTANPTAGSGFTAISGADFQLTEYKIVSATQTNLSVAQTTGSTDANGGVAIAIKQASAAKSVAAGAGSYAFTGTSATLTHKYIVSASAGAYTLTGAAATLRHAFVVAAGAGSYALTGTAASLLKTWRVVAGAGSYAFTGTDATLTHLSGKTVAADAGSYVLTGTAATLLHKYVLPAGAGAYTMSGVAATLRHGYVVTVGAGSYTVTGSAATLRKTWLLSGGSGSYVLSGSAATLRHGGVAGTSNSGVQRLRAAHEADDKEAYYREVRRREALQVQQIRLAELQQQQQEIEAKRALEAAQRQEAQVRRPKARIAQADGGYEARIASLSGGLAALNGAIIETRAEIARLDDIEMQEAIAASMREDDETILILAASMS